MVDGTGSRSTSSTSTSRRTSPSTAPGSPRSPTRTPYAGLLVSMHGAGIYRQRYGADPALALTRAPEVQALVDAFVAEQESGFPARMDEVGVDDELRLADYHRLQWFDRFSLAFCLRELGRAGEPFEVGSFRFEPVGPWRARVVAVAVRRADARVLARPPARAEARVAAGGVPRGVLRASGGARRDRARRVSGGRASHLAARPVRRRAAARGPRALAAVAREARLRPERAAAVRPAARPPPRLERLVRRGDEGRVRADEGRAGDDRRRRLGRERLRLLHGRARRRAAQADEGSGPRGRDRRRPHEPRRVEPRVRAMLDYAVKLTLRPDRDDRGGRRRAPRRRAGATRTSWTSPR